jgi:hypothetical protein
MYVIVFMILGSVISWVIFLVLLGSNLGVVTVGRNSLEEKKMLGVLFRVGHTCERRASKEKRRSTRGVSGGTRLKRREGAHARSPPCPAVSLFRTMIIQ